MWGELPDLDDILFGLAFILGTIVLSLLIYAAARRIAGNDVPPRHREMAGTMVVRIGALHALILALVFAQEMVDYQKLRSETATEVNAIADVYNDAARYGAVVQVPIQQALSRYVGIVVEKEWHSLGTTGELAQEAWNAWEEAYDLVLDIIPTSLRETSLRDHMLADIHAISESRSLREGDRADSLAGMFWFAAIAGVILIAIGHYVYPPERHVLVLLSLFSAYTGIILFLIYGFSNPYRPPAGLPPGAFERFQQEIAVPANTP
ncbi:MAG TPA: hypothetical protein VGM83_01345 [Devosiaceae bacterium]|jgi:hypothetical protein